MPFSTPIILMAVGAVVIGLALWHYPAIRSIRSVTLSGGIHYSWVIVAILAVVQIVGQSIGMSAGIMVAPLNDANGGFAWSIGTIGAGLATYYLVGAITAPICGWLGDRYGTRVMIMAGGTLFVSSMLLLGLITEVWHFFIVFGVMLATTQSIAMVPMIAAVSGWFRKRLGVAVGLLWAAGGLGAAVLAPAVAYLLENYGWQTTFWTVGLVGGAMIYLVLPFIRNRPADMGIRALRGAGRRSPGYRLE